MLEDVPANVTSELLLHQQLEKELNMENRIYGAWVAEKIDGLEILLRKGVQNQKGPF